MSTENFSALASAVVAASVASRWAQAVSEWQVVSAAYDPARSGVCVCGQTGLARLFTIENERNHRRLSPIGSTCVNLFGRADLDQQVDLFDQLLSLRNAIHRSERIGLTTEYFSRALLGHLYDAGAFTPDQWNHGDGRSDYEFLLKTFNKRNKDEITPAQHRKVSALVSRKVVPAILADDRLR